MGKAYVGININPTGYNSVSKKISKIYIGDGNGLAKEIKKAYIGVEGIAKIWWDLSQVIYTDIEYYGTATPLPVAKYGMGNASIDDLILFAGGSSRTTHVIGYDSSLTQVIAPTLETVKYQMNGTNTKDYMLFIGGATSSSAGTAVKLVEAYDKSLTKTLATELPIAMQQCNTSNAFGYAVVRGGSGASASATTKLIRYDNSLTQTVTDETLSFRVGSSSSKNDNYLIVAGGQNSTTAIQAYDSSFTITTPPALSVAGYNFIGTTAGKYALFAGGYRPSSIKTTVDTYDESLTLGSATALSVTAYGQNSGTTLQHFGIAFVQTGIDFYSSDLTKTFVKTGTSSTSSASVGTVGKYILIAGGQIGATGQTTVHAYQGIE